MRDGGRGREGAEGHRGDVVLTVCDKNGGCVFEVTPKTWSAGRANEVCGCTNHFRTDELSLAEKCDRYPKLEAVQARTDGSSA